MTNYCNACSDMDFIISNMNSKDASKIPDKLKQYFKNNKSNNYKVRISIDKPLYEQELSNETKMYLQITEKLFLGTQKAREEFINKSRSAFVQRKMEQYKGEKIKDYGSGRE